MSYRKLENIREKIKEETLKIGARYGTRDVSARRVSGACGISTHTIYNNFPSMRALIDEVAMDFDRKQMALVKEMASQHYTPEQILDTFLDKFIEDKTCALYYISYMRDFKTAPTTANPRAGEFLAAAKALFSPKTPVTDDFLLLVWNYIATLIFYYAEKIIRGSLKNDKETRDNIRTISMKGLSTVLA